MTNLTKDTIDEFIQTNQTVLIQFSTIWCQPCQRIKKRMPDIQKGFDLISFGYVDVDEAQEHDRVKELRLMAVPTFAIYHNGKLVKSQPTSDENAIVAMLSETRKL
jgi:thiol-disulfide isomerase/thioredoxin